MSNDKIRVLVVDDDEMVLRATSRVLKAAGFDVLTAPGVRSALSLAPGRDIAVVVSDLEMPVMHGDVFCREWQAVAPTPFILLSGSASVFERALACGARQAFLKPVDPKTLVAAVRDAVEAAAP